MDSTFRGSFAALPTPFRDGALDLEALRGLVELQAKSATRGVVPTGTTGEAATLSYQEFQTVVRTVVEASAGRLQVVAGIGTNDTRTTIERARFAERAGADSLLAVTPYYNRPSPEGLFQHFSALAEAVALPIVLYNIPSRTGIDLTPDVVERLTNAHGNIVAIKQASRSLARIHELTDLGKLSVLAGEDGLLFEFIQAGAIGVIGVLANIVPDRIARLIELSSTRASETQASTVEEARKLADELAPLVEALFVESNPVPLKAALAAMGHCTAEVRLPLTQLGAKQREELERVLASYGLLNDRPVVRHLV